MFETYPQPDTPHTNTDTIEYSGLVDAAQLSTARLLDIPGSLEAHHFEEVLAPHTETERSRIIAEVGAQFDESLIQFVIASLIRGGRDRVIILVEDSEGINGGLPWQPKLAQQLSDMQRYGTLPQTQVQVERYSTQDISTQAIDSLTQAAQDIAR